MSYRDSIVFEITHSRPSLSMNHKASCLAQARKLRVLNERRQQCFAVILMFSPSQTRTFPADSEWALQHGRCMASISTTRGGRGVGH